MILIMFLLNSTSYGSQIIYPWRSSSVILQVGGDFEILFDNTKAANIDSVILMSEYSTAKLNVNNVDIGHFIYDHYTKKSVNNKIRVTVGDIVPVGLYDLIVYTEGEINLSPKSVKVVDELNQSQKIIHISDLHVSRNWKGTPEDGYAEELELLDKFVEVANIINPDYVIITGDNIMEYTRFFADSTGWGGVRNYDTDIRPTVQEKYRQLFHGASGLKGLYGLKSPFYLVAGNHDFYGYANDDYLSKCIQWNELCGLRVQVVSISGTRLILADDSLGDVENETPFGSSSMQGYQGSFINDILNKIDPGVVRIMAQHRPDMIDTSFLDKNKIDILLHGHLHTPHEEFIGKTPTFAVRSGVVCRSGEIENWEENLGMFRIINIEENGSFDYTPPLRFCSDPTVKYDDLDLNLRVEFSNENNGNFSKNKAFVSNKFSEKIKNCKIQFKMNKGDYDVVGDHVYNIFSSDDYTFIDVYFDIDKKSDLEIIVFAK